MDTFLQAMAAGILIGGLYGLVSVGLSLIFGVLRIVNFAHGEFVMLGMYGAYVLQGALGLDPLVSLLILGPVFFVFGALVQHLLLRRILVAPDLAQIFLTVGLSIVLANVALLVFGADYRGVSVPYGDAYLSLGAIILPWTRIIAFAGAAILAGLLTLFLSRTDLGRAMRAAAQDREVAMLLGIDPDRVFLVAFGIGAALAAAAGVLLVTFFPASPTAGTQFGLIAFVVVILGGLGSLGGALAAGFVVGVVESLGRFYLQADWALVLVFGVMLLALNLRSGRLLVR